MPGRPRGFPPKFMVNRGEGSISEGLKKALAEGGHGDPRGGKSVADMAPSLAADLPAPRVDRGNALFSSLKPNRGERIRTFDFLVPNQAL